MSLRQRIEDWIEDNGGQDKAYNAFETLVEMANHIANQDGFQKKEAESIRKYLSRFRSAEQQEGAAHADEFEIDLSEEIYRFTFADGQGQPFSWDVPFREVSDWCWWYTHKGQNETQDGVSLLAYDNYGRRITPHWIGRAFRVMGVTKRSPPMAPHELDKYRSPDDIEHLVYQRRRASANVVIKASAEKQWRRIAQDYRQQIHDRETWLDRAKEALAAVPLAAPLPPKRKNARQCVVTGMYDTHIGKRSGEQGLAYTVQKVRDIAEKTAQRIEAQQNPDTILVTFGGDFFHVDTFGGATTRGTPQDVDATTGSIMYHGIQAAVYYLDVMANVAPVQVVIVPGNHDEVLTWALANALAARYQDREDVRYDWKEEHRVYVQYGKSLLGFTHGHGPKIKDLPNLMAHEAAAQWGQCPYRYWFHGHLHTDRVLEHGGATMHQLRSLAGSDQWHKIKGYTMNRPGHQIFVFDQEEGRVTSHDIYLP